MNKFMNAVTAIVTDTDTESNYVQVSESVIVLNRVYPSNNNALLKKANA